MTETSTCASTSDQIRSGYTTAVNELMNFLLFSGSRERERKRERDRERRGWEWERGEGDVRVKRKRYLR